MHTVKYSILILLQFVSTNFYAQNSSNIILGNAFDNYPKILLEEHFDSTNDIITEVASEREKKSKSFVPRISIAPSTNPKRNVEKNPLGLKWSIGFGIGHSSHASTYSFDDGVRIKKFSGFRSIVLDTKIGWRFHKRVFVFGTWKFAPNNSIISPYRSSYLGGGLAYYFGDSQQFSIHGGLGKYQAKVRRNEFFGNGLLLNYGTTIKLINNFGIELNILSGKIKFDNANAGMLDSTELNITAGVALLF